MSLFLPFCLSRLSRIEYNRDMHNERCEPEVGLCFCGADDDSGELPCDRCGEEGTILVDDLCAACLAIVNADDATPVAEVDGDTTPLPAMSMAELVFGAGTVRP